MAKNIVTLNLDNTDYSIRPYGTCATDSLTADKTVSIEEFALCVGATVLVKFDNPNSAASPTLNINSTGANPIKWKGVSNDFLDANVYYEFMYDGANWVVLGEASRLNEIFTPTNDLKYPLHIKYTGESGNTEEFVYAGSESKSETLDLSDIFVLNSQKITYSELVELRNNNQLAQGRQYRIIDYNTIVNDPKASSAGHVFDIIVTADGPNRLSEIAKVCNHDDDGVFNSDYIKSTSDLLTHSMSSTSWKKIPSNQVSTIPEGIKNIMPDGVAEVDYDVRHGQFTRACIKGILKAKFQYTGGTNSIQCVGVDIVDSNNGADHGKVVSSDYHRGSTGYAHTDNEYYVSVPSDGSYVIRYFIEGNTGPINATCKLTADCYVYNDYFANSKLAAWDIKYCLDNDSSRFGWAAPNGKGVIYYMKDEYDNSCPYDFKNILFYNAIVDKYYYTFSYIDGDSVKDYTILSQNKCYNNSIAPYYYDVDKTIIQLNANVFKNTNINDYCYSNEIGPNCYDNEFGANCAVNTLRANCYLNVFGNSCSANIFESNCYGNEFGANCSSNKLGDYSKLNNFADYVQSNTLGVNCTYISLGSYTLRCNFGKKCSNCKISSDSAGDNLLSYVKLINFGDECSYVTLYSTVTKSKDSNYFQNYTLGKGLTGKSTNPITIEVEGQDPFDRSFETIIKKDNNGVIKQVRGIVEHYTYTLPTAEENILGGIKVGYVESNPNNDQNYKVQLDENDNAYVNVPWEDTNTDTKVTSVDNHYEPTENTASQLSATATGGDAVWEMDVVKGITIKRDAKGHVTGVNVTSGKIPANPNTDTKVTSVDNHYKPNNTDQTKSSGLYKITTDAAGHVIDAVAVEKSDITDLGIPEKDTTYSEATTTNAGLMSAADKSKLDGITSGTGNNDFTLLPADDDVLGGIKTGHPGGNKNYAVDLDSNNRAYVYVPWTDTDTKNTAGSTNYTSTMYLIGATSQAANSQTFSNSNIRAYDNGVLTAAAFDGGIQGNEKFSVNECSGKKLLKYFTLSGCTATEATGNKRYAGTVDSYGFPVSGDANGLLWLGNYSTSSPTINSNYGHQLGFSSDGRIYHRSINGTFPTTANGGSWGTIAFASDIPVAATNDEIDELFK